MENELDNLLRNKMSVNELEINIPDNTLVLEARKKISLRKPSSQNKWSFLNEIKKLIFIQNKAYHFVVAAMIIAGCFFFFSQPSNEPNQRTKSGKDISNRSAITSSTILATIDQFSQRKSSVNTSTALTSIITFITIN